MKRLLGLIVLIVLLSGCKTRYIPMNTVKHDSVYINRIKYDSIYHKDSIYMLVKGDTVYMYKYKYQYRDKLIRDTVNVTRRDSIPYPIEVVKTITVEKKLSWWQKLFIWSGAIAWGVAIVILFIKLNKHTNWFFRVLNILRKL